MVQNIFAPKATRVIRCLLVEPKRDWSILKLSKTAGVSYAYAYKVVQSLIRMGLCRRTENYRIMAKVKVVNPGELLTRWANIHEYSLINKISSYYSEEKNVERFLGKLSQISEKSGLIYALTLHAGANLVAPFVRPVDIHFYVRPDEIEAWVKNLELKPIEFGGNIHLTEPHDEGVFYGTRKQGGANVVSNIQLYIDLYNYPARGREAAEHLRRTAIGF